MHEASIVAALLERVEAEARARGATSVARVHLELGELSGVEPELLGRAFEVFREPTLARAAELAISTVPARWRCPRCARDIARGARLACPDCQTPARLVAGDEIVLARLEMEVH
jgi:hydrogenase nickel incorporation protein HypA/HybF